MLQFKEKRQLQDVLMSAIPALSKLKQFSTHELDENLETIANCDNLSTATFDLIEWATSEGRLAELVDAVRQNNPTNPGLKKFIEDVWKPLQPQQEPIAPLHQEPEQMLAEAILPPETSVELQNEPVDINTKRYLRPTSKEDKEQIMQGTEKPTLIVSLPFPLNATIELRNHINAARESIQSIYNMFLPEKEVFHDQCRFAIKQVQAAEESIGKDIIENVHLLSIHAPACSLLELEQTYFCEEARKTVILLQEFASQTSSLLIRKKISEKLQLLMRSLQESNAFIDTLSAGIQEEKVDN